MINWLKYRFALSDRGAKDLIKGVLACVLQNIVLMLPVSLLYFFIGDMMDSGVSGDRVWFYVIGIVVSLLLIFFVTHFQYNSTFLATYVETGVRRVTLAEKLRTIPLSYFGKKDLADLTNSIMADCATLETAFSHFVPPLAGAVISTSLISISLFVFNWKMALAALWVLPVAFAVVGSTNKLQHHLNSKTMAARITCADGIQECLETLCDLKSNNAEDSYLDGLEKKIRAVEDRTIKSEVGMSIFVSLANIILKLGIPSVAIVGSSLLISNEIDVLTFFMFLLVVSRLYDPLMGAVQNLAAVISTKESVDRMNEILQQPVQQGSDKLTNKGCDISFDHVGFSYKEGENVLEDVTFTAMQGEVTALVGPSGGGKTTVSRLAARFWDCTKGNITVGGMDVDKTDPETLLQLYSIVFQDVTLFNNTIMENIRIGRKDATDEEVLEAARLANCDEFAEKLPNGWNTDIGENGCELSGGERQRISIARAFLKNAPVILMDEATASLDVENEKLIQTALSRLIKDKTVLIIAHRMRTVASADKIVVLENGRATEQGTPSELLKKNGTFSRMCALQNESADWQIQ